ncbi:hypothetical protein QA645_09695 [Bradyrhizobium sp. CIAT3101]|uniref:hypothetical protein n=1 Tax=Bradyrhizobium sp. CIAT3101 TaxID=439387 RepID=UPI0024B098A5|nr:hypothetical protein [Bradyrhizobium sp. CIAT3101]WFU82987.1 hypothetical protein QA645_09695 [Bradyrhizobium sp. CIAT3101]
MKTLTLTATDGNGFRPPCFAHVKKNKEAFHLRDDLPHPIAMFNHSWSEVVSAFESCFRYLETVRNLPIPHTEDRARIALLEAMRDLYYRTTEFIENLDDCISKALTPDPKRPIRVAGASALRKRVSIPCNKLKHNHNRIHYVQAIVGGVAIPGFSIYQVKGSSLEPNPEIHKKRRAFSFNVELRRIFATIYLYAFEVGENISRLGLAEKHGNVVAEAPDVQTMGLIRKLLSLSPLSFADETSQHMPAIAFDNETLTVADNDGIILPAPIDCQMHAIFVGDGYTTSFAIP